jgi:hypothetical protein
MANEGDRIGGGTGGNTGGTGGPGYSSTAEGAGAGAAGPATDGQAGYGSAQPQVIEGEGDGDDRANRLGGDGGGIGTPAAAESGDMSAGRSGRTDTDTAAMGGAGIGDDPGGPGGMGGVRGGMPNPDHRPNGGVSPMQGEPSDRDRD